MAVFLLWAFDMRNVFTKSTLIAVAGMFFGCTGSAGIEVSPPPAPASGTLSVTWTVEGTDAPGECESVGAASLEVAVYDTRGVQAADVFANCGDFKVTVELPEGTYDADVTLLDSSDKPVSTTLTLNNLDVVAGTDLTSDIDFPTNSIL